MEAVGDLNGVRCTLTTTLGIRTGTIANDNRDTGMTPQPIGENFGSALIDQVDWAMRFQIDQDSVESKVKIFPRSLSTCVVDWHVEIMVANLRLLESTRPAG